jgi:hypothetical protein
MPDFSDLPHSLWMISEEGFDLSLCWQIFVGLGRPMGKVW